MYTIYSIRISADSRFVNDFSISMAVTKSLPEIEVKLNIINEVTLTCRVEAE